MRRSPGYVTLPKAFGQPPSRGATLPKGQERDRLLPLAHIGAGPEGLPSQSQNRLHYHDIDCVVGTEEPG